MNEPAPDDLTGEGKEYWDSIMFHVPAYDLRPDERRLLLEICRVIIRIDQLETAQESADLITRGSQGQDVISPYIGEARAQRSNLNMMMKSLKLPETREGAERILNKQSEERRAAGKARWAKPKVA